MPSSDNICTRVANSAAKAVGHRRTPSYTDLYDESDEQNACSPYESLRRARLGPALLAAIRLLLVFTLCEDGWRMGRHSDAQAAFVLRFMAGGRGVAPSANYAAWRRVVGLTFRVVGGAQIAAGAGVVAARDPTAAASVMAALVCLNAAVWATLVDRRAHIHGLGAYLCRMCASLGGLVALVAHAAAVGARGKELENGSYRAASRRNKVLHLAARCLLAPYFPCSGLLGGAGRFSKALGLLGAAALVAGARFSAAASILGVLLVVHGVRAYGELFAGHSKHADALLFALAQDLSVLGALSLLAVVGPGALSLDRLYREKSR